MQNLIPLGAKVEVKGISSGSCFIIEYDRYNGMYYNVLFIDGGRRPRQMSLPREMIIYDGPTESCEPQNEYRRIAGFMGDVRMNDKKSAPILLTKQIKQSSSRDDYIALFLVVGILFIILLNMVLNL